MRSVLLVCLAVGLAVTAVHHTAGADTDTADSGDSTETFVLEDVLRLVKGGISDEVVIAKLHESGAVFHMTVDDILRLKREGVSQTLLAELVRTGIGDIHHEAKSRVRELPYGHAVHVAPRVHLVRPWPRTWYRHRSWRPIGRWPYHRHRDPWCRDPWRYGNDWW